MGLVDDHEVVVVMENLDVKGHARLNGRVTVKKSETARGIRGTG